MLLLKATYLCCTPLITCRLLPYILHSLAAALVRNSRKQQLIVPLSRSDSSSATTNPAAMSSEQNNVLDKNPMIIYALPGSQYVFKVLAAIQSSPKHINHYVHFVPFSEKERAKIIPSGKLLVPEMQIGTGPDRVIVSDSEAILEYLHKEQFLPHLYPTTATHELSKRVSGGTLAASVWYFNWIDKKGHAASMRRQFGEQAPWFVPWFVVDRLLKPQHAKFAKLITEAMPGVTDIITNPESMPKALKEELEYLDGQFKSESQRFLIPEAKEPTAADFSTYALMERLVADSETCSDTPIYPAIPELKAELKHLNHLWKWHTMMRSQYKVQFKGKRVPPELLSKL